MSIGAISSSPAVPATTGATAARTQTAAGGSAATNAPAPVAVDSSGLQLAAQAQALVSKLKQQDTDVRQHEQAHLAVAGNLALSGASYTYERGPNGVSYAVSGEVQIDTSPGRTPEETIARAHAIEAAALAPADPSGADRAVAVQAQQLAAQAQAALAAQQAPNPPPASAPVAQPQPQTSTVNPVDAANSVNKAYGVQSAAPPSLDTYA